MGRLYVCTGTSTDGSGSTASCGGLRRLPSPRWRPGRPPLDLGAEALDLAQELAPLGLHRDVLFFEGDVFGVDVCVCGLDFLEGLVHVEVETR